LFFTAAMLVVLRMAKTSAASSLTGPGSHLKDPQSAEVGIAVGSWLFDEAEAGAHRAISAHADAAGHVLGRALLSRGDAAAICLVGGHPFSGRESSQQRKSGLNFQLVSFG
jgi:hypothetical protein